MTEIGTCLGRHHHPHPTCQNVSWMPGAYKFLKNNSNKKKIYLLTATPHKEISKICKSINVTSFFKEIFGHPYIKEKIVSDIIKKKN